MSLWGIAITPSEAAPWHAARIEALLESGCRFVHVRYSGATAVTIAGIISEVRPQLRERLTIHDHFDTLAHEGIGGIHLNSRNPQPPSGWSGRVSRSLHSLDELIAAEASAVSYDYVTLSPVFDSISKPGYSASGELIEAMTRLRKYTPIQGCLQVLALGGVTPERLPALAQAGFDGFAMLGSIAWNDTIENFNNSILCYNS